MNEEPTTEDSPALPHAAVDLRITAGNPTDEELAAVTAVLAAAVEQGASAGATEAVVPAPSAWERSGRAIRRPVAVGTGRWRGFSG